MFSSAIVQTLLVHTTVVELTGMYNIINKETWLMALLTYFAFTWSSLKSEKKIFKSAFLLKYFVQIRLFDYTKKKQKLVKHTL